MYDPVQYPIEVIRPDWDGMEEGEGVQVLDSTKVTLRDVFASRKLIAKDTILEMSKDELLALLD